MSLVVHLYLKIQELLLQAWFPKSTGSKSLKVKCERKRSFELKSHHLGPARMFEKSVLFFFLAYLHEGDWTAVADVLAQIKDWIYVI